MKKALNSHRYSQHLADNIIVRHVTCTINECRLVESSINTEIRSNLFLQVAFMLE